MKLAPMPQWLSPHAVATSDSDLWARIRQRYLQYWESNTQLWTGTTFLGVKVAKLPTDAWVYQELIARVRPDVLVETGSLAGGSALFFASIMDLIGHGQVISIDKEAWPCARLHIFGDAPRPEHPRIQFITASSTDPGTVEWVHSICEGKTALVVLDSDHRCKHVLEELDAYSPLVSLGSYIVVEDTALNEQTDPGLGEYLGADEAVAQWLPKHREFAMDLNCERFLITTNPGGYLKRIA